MILVVAMAAAIVLTWIRGGRLAALSRLSPRLSVLAVAAFTVQAAFIYRTPSGAVDGSWSWEEALFVGAHVLLLFMVWANRHLPGAKWIGCGLTMNLLVMLANGGWMPITPEALVQAGHRHLVSSLTAGTRVSSSKSVVLPRGQTSLWYLSDVFVLSRPFPVPTVFSLGDVLIAFGAFLLIQAGMLQPQEQVSR
jgi:hypothetical protein